MAGSAQAAGATVGTINQMASPNGCFTDASAPLTGCASGRGMLGAAPFFGSHAVEVSPDGKNVYVATFNSNGVAVFDRNSTTGVLTQKSGTAGCVVGLETPVSGCATGRALIKPTSVDVSPDGKSLYVTSIAGSAVAVFDRNTSNGEIIQKVGPLGCVANTARPDCVTGLALKGADVVSVSPDNKNVYVGTFESGGVAIFDRSTKTGAIVQKRSPEGCTVTDATTGCRTGRGIKGAEGLTVSPDGKSVYIGAPLANAVAVFSRNSKTGALLQPPGTAGCFAFQASGGCSDANGVVGADALQVSPDNQNLYVAGGIGNSVAIFKRSTRTGLLTQLSGTGGCYSNVANNPRCVVGVQLGQPEGIGVSPDGNTVYVGAFASSAVAVFDRVSYTGTITQRAGANGCITNVPTSGCTTGLGMDGANAIAIAEDGYQVYVGSYTSNAVNSFTRQQPPNGHVAVKVPSKITVTNRGNISVRVTCSGSSNRRCPGGISLRASSQRVSASALVVIGRSSFNIPEGQSANVSVELSPQALQYLQDNGTLPAALSMRVVEPGGQIRSFRQTVTLSLPGGGGGGGGGCGVGGGNHGYAGSIGSKSSNKQGEAR